MPRSTISIDAPAPAVYDLIANARRRAAWLPELDATRAPDRQLEQGDRFEGYSSLLAHRFVGSSHVTEAEPNVVLEEQVTIGAKFTTRWETHDRGGRTEVVHTLTVEFPGGPLGRIERWVLSRRLARLLQQGSQRLKQAAEGG